MHRQKFTESAGAELVGRRPRGRTRPGSAKDRLELWRKNWPGVFFLLFFVFLIECYGGRGSAAKIETQCAIRFRYFRFHRKRVFK